LMHFGPFQQMRLKLQIGTRIQVKIKESGWWIQTSSQNIKPSRSFKPNHKDKALIHTNSQLYTQKLITHRQK
jgi:hypothetical protein